MSRSRLFSSFSKCPAHPCVGSLASNKRLSWAALGTAAVAVAVNEGGEVAAVRAAAIEGGFLLLPPPPPLLLPVANESRSHTCTRDSGWYTARNFGGVKSERGCCGELYVRGGGG